MKIRLLALFSLLGGITSVIFILIAGRNQPILPGTLSPFFQQLGKPIQSANRAISKLMPISDIDEKMLGEEFRARYEQNFPMTESNEKTRKYLIELIRDLTNKSQKGFDYTVFLVPGPPNAFALPGGVICVTEGLLNLISCEAELVAILGHEIGHIERGHLFDRLRKEMLRRKLKKCPIEDYTTDAIQSLGRLLFSKAEEDEADEYGFQLLVEKGYDPFAMSTAFKKFLQLQPDKANWTQDFLSTHPYMGLREAKFYYRAKSWQAQHPETRAYIGIKE